MCTPRSTARVAIASGKTVGKFKYRGYIFETFKIPSRKELRTTVRKPQADEGNFLKQVLGVVFDLAKIAMLVYPIARVAGLWWTAANAVGTLAQIAALKAAATYTIGVAGGYASIKIAESVHASPIAQLIAGAVGFYVARYYGGKLIKATGSAIEWWGKELQHLGGHAEALRLKLAETVNPRTAAEWWLKEWQHTFPKPSFKISPRMWDFSPTY